MALTLLSITTVLVLVLATFYVYWQYSLRLEGTEYQLTNTPRKLWSSSQDGPFSGDNYLVGVGKSDITGPIVEINFMGYADPKQVGTGLRQRLYSRAFIIGNVTTPEDRVLYLVLDTQAGDTAIRYGILEALDDLGPGYSMYGSQNVAVTGTHSHSGPGAWLNYLLPQITSKGFDKPSYEAIVHGAVKSIKRAHESLAVGKLSIMETEIADANVNRSPYAYLANPQSERDKYKNDVDKTLTMLRFSRPTADGADDIGVLTWFPVHGTSMQGNNTLVTGDNKGVAAYLFEQAIDKSKFVAGFSQSNVGDTSPNVLGAYCEFGTQVGQECDFETSLCGNKTQPCHGRGPFWGLHDAGTASTFEIGRRQYRGAKDLFDSLSRFRPIHGPVKAAHEYADFSRHAFVLPNGTRVSTCPAALGHSFAAGTSDGPGAFDFKQAQPDDPHTNPLWSLIGNRLHKPNATQIACQGVKPILLDVGESYDPYAWIPNIVEVQLFRVGRVFMIISPGEATTMAGRRWKDAISTTAQSEVASSTEPIVVLGGPANSYTHYITTEEEYDVQRYEGASTLYGPHTLNAYIDRSKQLVSQLHADVQSRPKRVIGPLPPNNINSSLSFITGVVADRSPLFKSFGDVLADVHTTYRVGQDVSATFVGANPRVKLRQNSTYAAVEKLDEETRQWTQYRDDEDWSLILEWRRMSTILATSQVKITWETRWEEQIDRGPSDSIYAKTNLRTRDREVLAGTFRLRYFGDAKLLNGRHTPFEGASKPFRVTQ